MDTLITFSCFGAEAGGVANSFYNRQKDNINQIIGADTGVYVNVKKTEVSTSTGAWFWKKTVVDTVSSLDIYTGTDISNANGFKLYSNNSNSGVDYLGGLGYHFTSIKDLITMARSYK